MGRYKGDKAIAEKPLPTHSQPYKFDSLLQLRQELIALAIALHGGLSSEERRELWTLNQSAATEMNLTA